jgi:glycosyltransferase involved in cell wall biosynthesis
LAFQPNHADVQMTFTSSGPTLDAARRLAEEAGPADPRKTIAFLGGVSDDELLGHLQSSHIYVSLSRSDGTSISLLEALAAALEKAVSDPSLRTRAAPINRQLALQRADAAKNMSLLISTLETLLAARTGP